MFIAHWSVPVCVSAEWNLNKTEYSVVRCKACFVAMFKGDLHLPIAFISLQCLESCSIIKKGDCFVHCRTDKSPECLLSSNCSSSRKNEVICLSCVGTRRVAPIQIGLVRQHPLLTCCRCRSFQTLRARVISIWCWGIRAFIYWSELFSVFRCFGSIQASVSHALAFQEQI